MLKLRFNAHGSKTFIAVVQSTSPMNNIDWLKAIKKKDKNMMKFRI